MMSDAAPRPLLSAPATPLTSAPGAAELLRGRTPAGATSPVAAAAVAPDAEETLSAGRYRPSPAADDGSAGIANFTAPTWVPDYFGNEKGLLDRKSRRSGAS